MHVRYQTKVANDLGVNVLDFYGDDGARFERNGFVFHLYTREDDMGDGIFTDRWQRNAVQNPAWRPDQRGYDRCYRYWIPEHGQTQREIANGLSRFNGMSRHDAWVAAGRSLIEDLETARHGSLIIVVKCYKNGIKLGSASIGTNYFEDDAYETYMIAEENGLFEEAEEEARNAIKALAS